jgi:PAS domain S-box-containing protein
MDQSSSRDADRRCRRLEERLRVLSEAMHAFGEATTDSQRLLDTVARRVAEVVKDYCLVLLLSEDGLALTPAAVFDPDPEALRQIRDVFSEPYLLAAHAVGRRVHETGEPFFAPKFDLEQSRPPRSTPRAFEFMQRIGMHSLLIVGLRAHDRSLGQLVLARFRPDSPAFDEHDLAMAQSLAGHAALAVYNGRLLAEARRESIERARIAERLRILTDASHEFSAATYDYDRLLEVVARRLGELGGDMCAIRAVSDDGEWLESTGAAYHRDPALLAATREIMASGRQRIGEGISGRVARSGEPLVTHRTSIAAFAASSEPRYRPFLERLGITTAITLPLMCRGKIVGVANLMRSDSADPYDGDDLLFVQSVADHAALAIGNARSYAAERAAREAAEKATTAMRQAEARFARLSEAGIIGILVSSMLDSRVLAINDTLLDLVGYSRDEILSGEVAWPDLTPPEWRAVDARAADQLSASGIAGLREKEYLRKSGTRVPVLAGSAMLEGEARECVSFVLDLTERKEAQAAIAKMREELALDEKARRLAAIVDSSDEAIVGKTLQGVVTSWNQGARRMFGYAADEIIGKSISLLVPPGRESEEPAILETVAKGEVKRFDTVRRRKDGQEIDVAVTISPVRDATGRVVSVSKVARDITERRRAEEALARAKDAAEAATRELEAFSYSVAHDLRAPLRGMNGFAQVLLEDYADKLDAEGRDCLDEICSNARRMGSLIDGLLSLSRVTRGDWRPERIDLSALVRDTTAQLVLNDSGRKVSIVVQPHISAAMDPSLARVLVENLLGNAWKFTAYATAPRIEFGATAHQGEQTLYVRDNGAGFDMEYAGKLFAPFQRLHTVAEFPGTGIGLATVQRIVHRHGGRIWAEGKVEKGATFYFTLPGASQGELTLRHGSGGETA